MRSSLPSRLIATGFIAALLLTGCSAKDSNNAEAQPSETSSSAAASADASKDATASSTSASSEDSGSAEASSSATALPTLANGQEVTLTDAERTDFNAGKYVPATAQHPALNVPEPVMPEVAKEQTFEGAKAFLEYWVDSANYATQTGKTASVTEALTGSDMEEERRIYEGYREAYQEGAWSVGSKRDIEIQDGDFQAVSNNLYDLIVVHTRTSGEIYEGDGTKSEDIESFNTARNPQLLTLKWENGQWKMKLISGIEGVTYGE
ncbi:hypothetical protein HF984_04390 [Rothia terrae]|uniref:DUF6318 domain-containing protein n=1 Tax=Rothia terrae TaxID=396015 RepID=A0A7H2BE80_9MICC|nr:DUF6318 family protein [Rothia terrae]NKZ34011.1 hypothetical protein [Rothia terrae]QNV37976.1 hypothetical protein IDM49_01365 [Rothia terrae]